MKKESIVELVELTVKLSKKLVRVSVQIIDSIEQENFDRIIELTENRDRLIKLINGLLETINCFNQQAENAKEYKLIQSCIQKSISLDEKILELLEMNKEKLKVQISQIFKNKSKISGYNLKSTRT